MGPNLSDFSDSFPKHLSPSKLPVSARDQVDHRTPDAKLRLVLVPCVLRVPTEKEAPKAARPVSDIFQQDGKPVCPWHGTHSPRTR